MKIPIILTLTKGKSKEELVKEVMKAIKNFFEVEQKVKQKLVQKSSPKKK